MPHYGHAHRNRHKTTDTRTVFHDPYTLEQPNGEERMVLFPKDTVEVFDHDRGRSLLTIKYFEQEFSHPEEEPGSMNIRVFIVGRRYIRFRDYEDLGGFLAQSPYEVCETSRGRYNISQIRRKVKLIKTNNHEYREFQAPSTFLCRYIRRENAIVGLSAEQADEGRTRIDDTRKRNMFIHHRAKPPVRQPRARYTFGDGFCGVGGCSAGARMAGLNVKWAFDADPATCRIYSENFPRANVMLARVDQFLSLGNLGYVDVMHLSPPCQTWSMAHTIPGCNDDMNSACLFAVELLLKTYRPRIATLEQVPGIVRKIDNQYPPPPLDYCRAHERNFFHSMLRIFLDNGYSIEWKILKTQDFGVPQTRERLILLASWSVLATSRLIIIALANLSQSFHHQLMALHLFLHTSHSQMQYVKLTPTIGYMIFAHFQPPVIVS